MDLVIQRSKWLCGDYENSMLYRPKDGKMCCLGFLACTVGYSIESIDGHGTPAEVDIGEDYFPSTLVRNGEDTPLCSSLLKVNDNPDLTQSARESILRDLFKTIDIQVCFIN